MTYSIEVLAQKHCLTQRAIGMYEELGMLSPARGRGRVRVYSENDSLRVAEIVKGERMGFTPVEIKLRLEDGPTGPWLRLHPKDVDIQIAVMRQRLALTAAGLAMLVDIQHAQRQAVAP